jgi:hypothetical protein
MLYYEVKCDTKLGTLYKKLQSQQKSYKEYIQVLEYNYFFGSALDHCVIAVNNNC